MDGHDAEFKAALNEILRAQATEHLPPEQLAAYHHDLLSAEDEETAREHLAACRMCSDLLLETIRFEGDGAQDETRAPGVVDFEAEADWRSLQARLHEEEPANEATGMPAQRSAPAASAATSRWALGLAASLLATVGLGIWVVQLESELAALRQPQTNLEIISLEPDGFTRGDLDEVTVRGASDRFVVILNPSLPADSEHEIEILDSDGRLVWAGKRLSPTDLGTFYLELSRSLLPPGTYSIRLRSENESQTEFVLRVAEP